MTDKKGKEALIGRAVIDPEFRQRLLDDPEDTISSEGYNVSDDVIQTLKNLDPETAKAATEGLAEFEQRRAAG